MIIYDSPESILKILNQWKSEMDNPDNDDWAKEEFKQNLLTVQQFFVPKHLDIALEKMKNDITSFENEVELYETYGGD